MAGKGRGGRLRCVFWLRLHLCHPASPPCLLAAPTQYLNACPGIALALLPPYLQVKDPTKSYLSQVTNDNGTVSSVRGEISPASWAQRCTYG